MCRCAENQTRQTHIYQIQSSLLHGFKNLLSFFCVFYACLFWSMLILFVYMTETKPFAQLPVEDCLFPVLAAFCILFKPAYYIHLWHDLLSHFFHTDVTFMLFLGVVYIIYNNNNNNNSSFFCMVFIFNQRSCILDVHHQVMQHQTEGNFCRIFTVTRNGQHFFLQLWTCTGISAGF